MNIKKIIACSTMILGLSTFVYAEPFSDVYPSHWAYEAVSEMAQKGIIQGFPNGTFKGNEPVTRYQLAMITAKMLANVEQLGGTGSISKNDLQTLEKLTVEFADELALLGVKVTALEDDMQVVKEDVAGLKKDVAEIKDYTKNNGSNIKISGDIVMRNHNVEIDEDDNGNAGRHLNRTSTKFRLRLDAQVSKNVKASVRWDMIQNNTAGIDGVRGTWWTGNNFATGDVDIATLEIKDFLNTGGKLTLGRKYYTHGHCLVLNNQMDAINYTKKVKDITYTFNLFYNRQGDEDYRNIWNINVDTKCNGHDLYLGLYYQTLDDNFLKYNNGNLRGAGSRITVDPFNNVAYDTVGNANYFNESKERYYIELGGKGKIGNSENWSYDLGAVYEHTDDGQRKNPNDPNDLTREDSNGIMVYAAAKYDSKKQFKAKLAYTLIDDEANGLASTYIARDKRWTDSPEHPLEDIIRDSRYNRVANNNNFITNLQDIKIQAEYTPKNNDKHIFRLAYDILTPKNDDKTSMFFMKKADNGQPKASDKANIITFEYKYKLAKNTRIRIGYTDFKYDSGNAFSDYNMFWTEIYVKY